MPDYNLPPDPTNASLKRIYPWDTYNTTLVMQWLYTQAHKTGITGTFEDFKQRYGTYIEATDPTSIYDLIDNYTGTYHITPMLDIEQRLKTANKVLNQDIIIDPIPDSLVPTYDVYKGRYSITPLAYLDQLVRTANKIMEEDIVIEKIPYAEVSNTSGGKTVTIG